MMLSDSGAKSKVKQIKPQGKTEVKPAPKVKQVSKIDYREGHIVLYRKKASDEWRIKGAGEQVARNADMLINQIPPEAEEAFLITLELPFENK